MKKVSLVLILVLVVAFSICPMAFASGEEYVLVTGSNTIFFSDEGSTPLFKVTEDCYVKFDHISGDYAYVEYFGEHGFVHKNDLDLQNPKNGDESYFGSKLSVDVTAIMPLYFSPSNTQQKASIPKSSKVQPLGTYTNDSIEYAYVKYETSDNGIQYGAVYLDNLNWNGVITPPQSTQPGGSTTPDINQGGTGSSTPELTPQEPENNLVRILLIVGICVPALIIVYLIFKPVKPTSNRYASDNPRRRDDYEDFE